MPGASLHTRGCAGGQTGWGLRSLVWANLVGMVVLWGLAKPITTHQRLQHDLSEASHCDVSQAPPGSSDRPRDEDLGSFFFNRVVTWLADRNYRRKFLRVAHLCSGKLERTSVARSDRLSTILISTVGDAITSLRARHRIPHFETVSILGMEE